MAIDTAVAAAKVGYSAGTDARDTKSRFFKSALNLQKPFEAKAHNLFTGIKFALGAIHVVDPDRSL